MMGTRYAYGDVETAHRICSGCGAPEPLLIHSESGTDFYAIRTDVGVEICGRMIEVTP